MSNGWQVVVNAQWREVTLQRPYGLKYAIILQDGNGERLLGFDNSHGYDDAPPSAPFDHEHKAGEVGRRFAYPFADPWSLVCDFLDRCEQYCRAKSVTFDPAWNLS